MVSGLRHGMPKGMLVSIMQPSEECCVSLSRAETASFVPDFKGISWGNQLQLLQHGSC